MWQMVNQPRYVNAPKILREKARHTEATIKQTLKNDPIWYDRTKMSSKGKARAYIKDRFANEKIANRYVRLDTMAKELYVLRVIK